MTLSVVVASLSVHWGGFRLTGGDTFIDLVAATTNALNAALLVRRPDHYKNFTVVGILLMALLGGLSGGVARDVLVNRIPVALTNPAYITLCLAAGVIGYYAAYSKGQLFREGLYQFALSFSLPWYAIVGAQTAVEAGIPVLGALALAIIGATAGRFMVDVTCGIAPKHFVRGEWFVGTAVLTGGVWLIMTSLGAAKVACALVAFAVGFTLGSSPCTAAGRNPSPKSLPASTSTATGARSWAENWPRNRYENSAISGSCPNPHRPQRTRGRDSPDLMGQVVNLALLAAVNPTLLAVTTVMLVLPRPERLMVGYWVGAMLTSVTLGLAIVFALDGSSIVSTTKKTLSPAADLVLAGILLILAAVLATGGDKRIEQRRERRKAKPGGVDEPPKWQQQLAKGTAKTTVAIGALLSLPGLFYLEGLDHITKLHYSTVVTVLVVVGFNLTQLLVIEIPIVAFRVAPTQTPNAVEHFKEWAGMHGRQYGVWALVVIAAALAIKGIVTAT
jgi:uncharacterized membrane protein YeiH